MMNKKYLNLLGLANVAKGIVSGETLIKSIAANETKLVVIANDASANTKKKITDKCHFYHVDYFIVDENIETISKAVGKNNRVALGIINQGFAKKIKELINNEKIIRNKLKIKAAINNAKIFKNIQKKYKTFYNYLATYTGGKIIYELDKTSSKLSDEISKDLKKQGMKFVGTTIIYSYLQAVGIINSHENNCYLNNKK